MIKQILNPLIETSELAKVIQDDNNNKYLTIINANFGFNYKTHVIRPADTWADIFKKERIPRARHLNIAMIGDKSHGLPNMLPTIETFIQSIKDLDIGKNDHIVCYGDEGIVGACRAWWMFKVFGFSNVQVMNGTFNKWKKENLPIESGDETWLLHKRIRSDDDFKVDFNKNLVTYMEQIQKLIDEKKMNEVNVVDARSKGRFEGTDPDPKGLRVRHMPGAKNIPFNQFINIEEDDVFKSPEELIAQAKEAGIDLEKPTKTTCGSGMTASVLYFGFNLLGIKDLSLYDGSWAEWAKHKDNIVVTGLDN